MSSTQQEPSGQAASNPEREEAAPTAETRRAAVQRLGKFAAYTAPALLAILSGTTTARAC